MRAGFAVQAAIFDLDNCLCSAEEERLYAYRDVHLLQSLPLRRYLVTTGRRQPQEDKVRLLGIRAWFEQVVVDAVDEPGHPGKRAIFDGIARQAGFPPRQVLVIGDDPQSELAAGRALGMVTIQLLRPGVVPAVDVDMRLAGLRELVDLVRASV